MKCPHLIRRSFPKVPKHLSVASLDSRTFISYDTRCSEKNRVQDPKRWRLWGGEGPHSCCDRSPWKQIGTWQRTSEIPGQLTHAPIVSIVVRAGFAIIGRCTPVEQDDQIQLRSFPSVEHFFSYPHCQIQTAWFAVGQFDIAKKCTTALSFLSHVLSIVYFTTFFGIPYDSPKQTQWVSEISCRAAIKGLLRASPKRDPDALAGSWCVRERDVAEGKLYGHCLKRHTIQFKAEELTLCPLFATVDCLLKVLVPG